MPMQLRLTQQRCLQAPIDSSHSSFSCSRAMLAADHVIGQWRTAPLARSAAEPLQLSREERGSMIAGLSVTTYGIARRR